MALNFSMETMQGQQPTTQPSHILPSRIPKAQHKYKQKKKQNSKTFVKVQELKHITAY